MSTQAEPEVVLYDLASTKNVCFSPVVWRIRLMLNYKKVPYKTVFLEFPDIEPTLKGLGLVPGESARDSRIKYTVPAIHHVPTGRYIMESQPIAQFIESTYPEPPVPLSSELGDEIQQKARAVVGPVFYTSVMPREMDILAPGRVQEYFRRTRETFIGHPLEDLLDSEKEEQGWKSVQEPLLALDQLLRTNEATGPFVLGAHPSYADFFITGSLQCAREVDERVFERLTHCPGHKQIYEACLPYMDKRD